MGAVHVCEKANDLPRVVDTVECRYDGSRSVYDCVSSTTVEETFTAKVSYDLACVVNTVGLC